MPSLYIKCEKCTETFTIFEYIAGSGKPTRKAAFANGWQTIIIDGEANDFCPKHRSEEEN
jgi:hypothetical protein